ncbi:MAG: helix-turn-helix domain-containing protein [Candidatus Thermoplasmatota archaeon]
MDENCTVYKTIDFIAKKWTLLILLELYKGEKETKRYSDLKKSLPEITPKILSTRLRELEQQKMIIKKIDASKFPVKCEYSLTQSSREFIRIIKDIKTWALTWKFDNELCEGLDCKNCLH